eukprot:1143695-Pelagomonas_calceolata.AAC.2
MASFKISNAFWHMKAVTPFYKEEIAGRFTGQPGRALCPLCQMHQPMLQRNQQGDSGRNIPSWLYPSEKTPGVQQSRQDGVIVIPLEVRNPPNSLRHMNPRDRIVHLIELKICSDVKPEQTITNCSRSTQAHHREPQHKIFRGTP